MWWYNFISEKIEIKSVGFISNKSLCTFDNYLSFELMQQFVLYPKFRKNFIWYLIAYTYKAVFSW